MFGELLLEIGTEEIPSDYLEKGLEELKSLAETGLRDNRIEIKEGMNFEVWGVVTNVIHQVV